MNQHTDRPLNVVLGWRLPGRLLDVAPVAFIVLVGAAGLAAAHRSHVDHLALLALGLVAATVALLMRHRSPLVVLGIALVLSLALGYGPVVMLPVLLAVFTVAEYTDRRRLAVAAVAAVAAVLATQAIYRSPLSPGSVFSALASIGMAVAAGLYLRARADYIVGLRERAERLEREHELLAQQAVGEERVRIARELHDVVAHNVSLMVVQAQALAATGADETQHTALTQLAGLGRDALSEMHRMLAVLRLQDAGAPERAPQPGVRDLPGLVERARTAGLDAILTIEGQPQELPAAVDLSAYRIVQEALTNVIRHAGASRALVTLAYSPSTLEVVVLDDGVGVALPTGGAAGGGHGLVGMRERVALFGGQLETGPRKHGPGYRVRALLPIN